MAMESKSMASYIMNSINQISVPADAINSFYKSLCEYVENNAQVFYDWAAISPTTPPAPDPQILIEGKIKTRGELVLSGESTPEGACNKFASDLNKVISTWTVEWPTDFSIMEAFILPEIVFKPCGYDNRESAWEYFCNQIILGIKQATLGPLSGTHGIFVSSPGATFKEII